MGHDIAIGDVTDTGITGNFNCMSDEIKGSYTTVYHWHGHEGAFIAKLITNSLKKMDISLIDVGVPDETNSNWGWGVNKNTPMTELEFAQIYRYHLERFLVLANKYPGEIWMSDQVWEIASRRILVSGGFLSMEDLNSLGVLLPEDEYDNGPSSYEPSDDESYEEPVKPGDEQVTGDQLITHMFEQSNIKLNEMNDDTTIAVGALNAKVDALTTKMDALTTKVDVQTAEIANLKKIIVTANAEQMRYLITLVRKV
jgi:hypothetical protein